MNMDEEKIQEYKFKNSLSVRQNATQSLIVLIGGVVGLCFAANSFLKFFFITIGVLYIFILGKNLFDAETTLASICKQKENNKC